MAISRLFIISIIIIIISIIIIINYDNLCWIIICVA